MGIGFPFIFGPIGFQVSYDIIPDGGLKVCWWSLDPQPARVFPSLGRAWCPGSGGLLGFSVGRWAKWKWLPSHICGMMKSEELPSGNQTWQYVAMKNPRIYRLFSHSTSIVVDFPLPGLITGGYSTWSICGFQEFSISDPDPRMHRMSHEHHSFMAGSCWSETGSATPYVACLLAYGQNRTNH